MTFWRLAFSSTSTLDHLLDKPSLTVEELLDEDDLLQECKSQNSKLIGYLSQPRHVKRLCEHVVGSAQVSGLGGSEWEEKVRFKYPYVASEVLCSDIPSIADTALANADTILDPFWNNVLHSGPARVQPPHPHHSHPLLANDPSATPQPPGKRTEDDQQSTTSAPPPTDDPPPDPNDPSSSSSSSSSDAVGPHLIKASDNGPGKSVLAGYWAKVNGVLLDKKPLEMLGYIRQLPRIVERFVAHLETPAVVDLLYRIISSEQAQPSAGVVDWLSSQDLIPLTIELLSPSHSVNLHNTVSDLIKAIIALSAPAPAGIGQGQDPYAFGGATTQEQAPRLQNKLVRELAAEPIIRRIVSFMLDSSHSTSLTRRLSIAAQEQAAQDAGLTFGLPKRRKPSENAKVGAFSLSTLNEDAVFDDDDEEDDSNPQPLNPSMTPAFQLSKSPVHRDSTSTLRPDNFFPDIKAPEVPVTPETRTSALVTGIGIFIELIRKNNSDYFEQHLFHVLRTHLLQRQQEIAQKKMEDRAEEQEKTQSEGESSGATPVQSKEGDDEDEEMEGMEEAMAELTEKLGIVHLGPMLSVLCERLPDLQEFIQRPQSPEDQITTTLGKIYALTFERYRITELYAELLHCSNMALLNRAPGEGPQYSADGILQGGISGLQVLARTLQGGDADDAGDGTPNTGTQSHDKEGSVSGPETAAVDVSSPPPARHQRQSSSLGEDAGDSTSGGSDVGEEARVSVAEAESDPFADEASSVKSPPQEAQRTPEEEEADARSLKSTLSSLSLADLVSPHPSGPPSPVSDAKEYVIGDLLKKKFLDCGVIPGLLDLFFAYPWNNFLHNAVYDFLQQCFNGRMDAGLNRKLTLAVFTQGHLPRKILEGHRQNNESMAGPRRIRLGFMGHANLIAEEMVKLLERYPRDITDAVLATDPDAIPQPEWDTFVDETLKENSAKQSAPLAGGRPVKNAFGFGGMEEGDDGLGRSSMMMGGVSGGTFGSGDNETFANYLSSQMNAAHATSDDDDSDEEAQWMASDRPNAVSHSFGDPFNPAMSFDGNRNAGDEDDDDDDDGWGAFASASSGPEDGSSGTFTSSYDAFSPSSRPNLTPADWAASGFRQENARSTDGQGASSSADVDADADTGADGFDSEFDPTTSTAGADDTSAGTPVTGATTADSDVKRAEPTSPSSDDQTPFVDLSDAASYRAAQATAAAFGAGSARRLSNSSSSEQPFAPQPVPDPSPATTTSHRRNSSSSSSGASGITNTTATGSTDPSAANATHDEEPLGPGVPSNVEVKDGMMQRALDDGSVVSVPLDDVALAQSATSTSGQAEVVEDSAVVDEESEERPGTA